ncbi:histidine phosphatase family protein [Cohnella sp. GbtcB17]|uniref:histidine phosphatase family protein n=1 Tax=Cohnella sp. GbtcB17 TaxID=2824762 RepID=UPI001C301085|nr:histidine phosphatase family protein [Cohnella sp. GbtcB17]
MTNLYFIRHGEACVLKDGIVDDFGLTEEGRSQAEKLRDRLIETGEIQTDVLIASSFLRAMQTAEVIAPAFDRPIAFDDEFQELRPGKALGLTKEQLDELLTDYSPSTNPFAAIAPDAENWPQFVLRIGSAIHRVCAEHRGRTVAIVCHGGVIECTFQYFFGLNPFKLPAVQFQVSNTSITHWSVDDEGKAALIKFNDARHLD